MQHVQRGHENSKIQIGGQDPTFLADYGIWGVVLISTLIHYVILDKSFNVF